MSSYFYNADRINHPFMAIKASANRHCNRHALSRSVTQIGELQEMAFFRNSRLMKSCYQRILNDAVLSLWNQ